ncbi:inosine-5'-monophosphate dehydrogenase [Methanobrevibacter cuticularis]|uniref:Inosine-5'-monophosphate dehydrogenase n=1 Tax=Methanobrevibacter cuticularis TaxID=47311 RepID=A0A166EF14_9EURY|nr:CBS domain-containing protein [Methanobrevibacter cuticularis]KZX16575.1 inosine-5'-monophosphate dehydrogenase [Methanobrevibacter cuticularis]
MKAKEMMDKNFIYVYPENTVADASIKMENSRRFTTPVVNEEMRLVGWITSLDVTKGLREGKKIVSEIMHPKEEIRYLHENDPSRLSVIETSKHKLISIPVLNENDVVTGVIRSFDIVDTLSSLYEVKVSKIYEAMEEQLKGVSWDELMEASAIISRRTTGKRIKPEDYERNIKNSTFGEAIWATGGLERFFTGLIAVGELVIARKVGKARK